LDFGPRASFFIYDTLEILVTSRYHIPTEPAPAHFTYPAKFRLGEGDEYVKYGHRALRPGRRGADPYWTPQIITQTWHQAETGRIPISGAGYGGAFAGSGFDSLWLDMSEIVRPTRDGIHGREYISTATDLGRKLPSLEFGPAGDLVCRLPPLLEIPLPVLFNPLPLPTPGQGARRAVVRAAARLGTLAFVEPEEWDEDLMPFAAYIAPRLSSLPSDDVLKMLGGTRLVELVFNEGGGFPWGTIVPLWEEIKTLKPEAIISLGLPLAPGVEDLVEELARTGAEVIHLYADDYGCEEETDHPRHIVEALRAVHQRLVEVGLRDEITLLASGGIATAEHVPKAIVCGADGVGVDFALLIALGCAVWADERSPCPVQDRDTDPEWGAQRIVNLMAAWRDQLLEVLGAMGMREMRRLRGETGRAIFYEKEEAAFRSLFPTAVTSDAPSLAVEENEPLEGDLRWPQELILATTEQARTGRPPQSGLAYRVGCSGGGFDRLCFAFEMEQIVREETPQEMDLSLDLNRRPEGPRIRIPLPVYGAGMSFGSIGLPVMLARAMAARLLGTFTSTGEGGYPDELIPYADHIITQIATGLFGVREETIQRARIVEFKYAQGAKPGLGGHLLGAKVTPAVAAMRESVAGTSLFSPFPFHSVYSVEDHKKHVDWVRAINPDALVSVKVSTPTDVDMVAVGSYYAGAHIIHLDGAYGGTGAAPEVAKKNIAMPIEYAIPKVHNFLVQEGIRDEIVLMASGGIRTAYDVAKAIALGADGCVIGTAELAALGCTRLGTCEKDRGCPFGIATTDPELSRLVKAEEAAQRIVNMYLAWQAQWQEILGTLGMRSIGELRGRTDLLVYLEGV
jgi:glutamate synthase domain-containing protein 2